MSGATTYPVIVTWYESGKPDPWRVAFSGPGGAQGGETRCPTYRAMLETQSDMWARLMPEPIET